MIMDKAKEVVEYIISVYDDDKLKGRDTNVDELAKIVLNYKLGNVDYSIMNHFKGNTLRVIQDRQDSPHHYSNRLD